MEKQDSTAAERKQDHIELAFESQVSSQNLDRRFYYEPLLAPHPEGNQLPPTRMLGKTLHVPLWVSSMTGGTEWAERINHNLAQACRDFGMGMGLGSCRSILFSDERFGDFDVRDLIGEDQLLFANLGIAQVEEIWRAGRWTAILDMLDRLRADGLIIHVNPFQEWLQPEGDRLQYRPIEVILEALAKLERPLIVKEVGQGMGMESLRALLELPLAAVDFAANGGTNFAKLELFRGSELHRSVYERLALTGHSAEEMLHWTNSLCEELGERRKCRNIIISGGVRSFLDGYYLVEKAVMPAVYGQASAFLKHARGDYQELHAYVKTQVEGLNLARAFLKIRE